MSIACSLDYQVRWLIRRDMPAVLDIEQSAFEYAWTSEDFIDVLKQRNCIGMVAERGERIDGYMVYALHESSLHLLNVAVRPSLHRHGIGSVMIHKLITKLSQQRRTSILAEVRETNLDAQLFFRAMGFRCVETIGGNYGDTDEDAYVFRFVLHGF